MNTLIKHIALAAAFFAFLSIEAIAQEPQATSNWIFMGCVYNVSGCSLRCQKHHHNDNRVLYNDPRHHCDSGKSCYCK